jgi:HK97 family phage major capsid protein
LLYGLKEAYQRNATWLFSKATLKKIRKMKSNNEYIWSPGGLGNVNNVTQGLAPTLLDRPYVVCADMPNTGTGGNLSVAVGDFKAGYTIGQNAGAGVAVLRDQFTQAGNGLVRFHGFYRVGGSVVMPEAIAILKESVS